MITECIEINFNWRFSNENGEEFDNRKVGLNNVIKILSATNLTGCFMRLFIQMGKLKELFNPNSISLLNRA